MTQVCTNKWAFSSDLTHWLQKLVHMLQGTEEKDQRRRDQIEESFNNLSEYQFRYPKTLNAITYPPTDARKITGHTAKRVYSGNSSHNLNGLL